MKTNKAYLYVFTLFSYSCENNDECWNPIDDLPPDGHYRVTGIDTRYISTEATVDDLPINANLPGEIVSQLEGADVTIDGKHLFITYKSANGVEHNVTYEIRVE